MAEQGGVKHSELKTVHGYNMTPKQARFVKEYVKSGNQVQSALKTYDTTNYSSASVIANENLEKLRTPIQIAMKNAGITKEKLMETLEKGLRSDKVLSHEGKLVKVEDMPTRHRYFDTALKLGDYYPSEKHEITGKDGGPLEYEVLAGIGYVNKERTTISATRETNEASEGSSVGEREEIQSLNMASSSQEDDDSDI